MRLKFFLLVPLAAATVAAQPYYLVYLRPDPARARIEKEDGDRIMAAHMANIHKMADDGVLKAAGPFDDTPSTISGIFVMQADTFEAAKRIAAQDPTVLAHRNTVDVHVWNAPAGIGDAYFKLHKADPKTPEGMAIHPYVVLLPGPNWEAGAPSIAEHDRYVQSLRTQKKLAAAGSIEAPDDEFAVVVFRPAVAMEDVQRLMDDDPAVKAGVIKAEYHKWWCAAHVLPWE